ncbi:MAG TPA: hypothetical protein VL359_02590 [bacterium]|nr:hypothetical protein [bacterium]
MPASATSHRGRGRPRLVGATALLVSGLLAACTVLPTPYQPLAGNGGYEEVRLQPDVYRVSFQGNAETRPVDVIDFAFLRCAELTLAAGYTHFVVLQQSAHTGMDYIPRSSFGVGAGMGFRGDPLMAGGFYSPPIYDYYVRDRAAILLIKMLSTEQAKSVPLAFDAAYVVKSLQSKKELSLEQKE